MRIPKPIHRFFYKIAYMLLRIYWFVFQPHTRSVLGLILNGKANDRSILLIRHTYDNQGWLFPGGSVKKRESPEEALKRELKEELDLQAVGLDKLTETDKFIFQHHSHVDYYVINVPSKEFQIDGVEIAEARWFPLSDLPPMTEGKEMISMIR